MKETTYIRTFGEERDKREKIRSYMRNGVRKRKAREKKKRRNNGNTLRIPPYELTIQYVDQLYQIILMFYLHTDTRTIRIIFYSGESLLASP